MSDLQPATPDPPLPPLPYAGPLLPVFSGVAVGIELALWFYFRLTAMPLLIEIAEVMGPGKTKIFHDYIWLPLALQRQYGISVAIGILLATGMLYCFPRGRKFVWLYALLVSIILCAVLVTNAMLAAVLIPNRAHLGM